LIGGILTNVFVYGIALPPRASHLPQFLILYIVIDVLCGLSDATVSYVGNLGGLGAGILLAAILQVPLGARSSLRPLVASIVAGIAGVSLTAFIAQWAPPSIDIAATVTRIMDMEPALQRRAESLLREAKGDRAALASRLEVEIISAWSAEQQSLERLRDLPPRLEREVQLLIDYCVVRKAGWQCAIDAMRGNQDRLKNLEALNRQTDEILRELARPAESRSRQP
jgi:hypothetical protein